MTTKVCPMCGHETTTKEFSGVPDLPDSIKELVDGVVEATGYGG